MTKQEFYDKYGSVKVKFFTCYKFTFTYAAALPDGRRLICRYGGNGDDIYRHEVNAEHEETVASISPHAGSVFKDCVVLESFCEY